MRLDIGPQGGHTARDSGERTFKNPVLYGERADDHGDPFILRWQGEYFLYHTGDTAGRRGISVYRSTDLVDWSFEGFALEPNDDESSWCWTDLWAPEVVYDDGTFYMYVSATTKRRDREADTWEFGEGDDSLRRIGVARALNPLGPFVFDETPLTPDTWTIDAHPFRDCDGKDWLFYNLRAPWTQYIDGTVGTGVAVQRIDDHCCLSGPVIQVAAPSDRWEGNAAGTWYWNEGPFVVQRRGRYYHLFSGGSFMEPYYGVGFSVADRPEGPWYKNATNPIWTSKDRLLGPGHFALILAPDGATIYVTYHAYVIDDAGQAYLEPDQLRKMHWDEGRKVCLDRFYWVGDRPMLAGPTAPAQTRPPQPVYDESVPFWRTEVWVSGKYLWVDGQELELDDDPAFDQLHLTQKADKCLVVERGAVIATLDGTLRPRFDTDGALGNVTVTSFYEDEELHVLDTGETASWHWGGTTPVEINLAVKGSVRIHLDGDIYEERGSSDEFRLVVLHRRAGMSDACVEALESATVTDLLIYAR